MLSSNNELVVGTSNIGFEVAPYPTGWRQLDAPMTETTDLTESLEEALPVIDRVLAKRDIALKERPLSAAIEFVSHFVLAVQDGESPETKHGEPSEFLATQWFASLYGLIETWYGRHYPGAMEQERDNRIFGIVIIAGTVFAIRIPAIRRQPGRPGETVWISFPDGLREGESALDWIDTPPNFAMLSPKELRKGEEFATAVANDLRFIRTGLMAVTSGDSPIDGFRAGIMPRLRRAAELLREPRLESVQQSYWELQLACEMALKALLQQRTGSFRETHDLFNLYDAIPAPVPAFKRDLLKRLPRWEETADLRYGQGKRSNRADCAKCYRAALSIVAGAVRSMEKFGIGNASFEIAQPPWMAVLSRRWWKLLLSDLRHVQATASCGEVNGLI